jgi:hypothetical protein
MAELPQLRAADSDRDRAATDLREHFAAGRLSEAEFSERLEAVYAATTVGELTRIRADLPDPGPLPVPAGAMRRARAGAPADLPGRRRARDPRPGMRRGLAATGADGQFWPLWVIAVSALRLARDAWRLLGPAPDTTPRRRSRRRF